VNLKEAIAILNEARHRGSDRWSEVGGLRSGAKVRPFDDTPSPAWLDEFEAVAIAERYVREPEPTTREKRSRMGRELNIRGV
jgi:hypothetical protein